MSVGLLERHDPACGRVVVHPPPGARSLQAFAHDVLGALGRAVNRLAAEQLTVPAAAWRAVTAWMVTGQIEDLVVGWLTSLMPRRGPWADRARSRAGRTPSHRTVKIITSANGHRVLLERDLTSALTPR